MKGRGLAPPISVRWAGGGKYHINITFSLYRVIFLRRISHVKTVIFTNAAAKQLDALPDEVREAIETSLDGYAMTGQGDVKALSGRVGYRLRVGSYRVIFAEDQVTVLAVSIGRRQTATYKRN